MLASDGRPGGGGVYHRPPAPNKTAAAVPLSAGRPRRAPSSGPAAQPPAVRLVLPSPPLAGPVLVGGHRERLPAPGTRSETLAAGRCRTHRPPRRCCTVPPRSLPAPASRSPAVRFTAWHGARSRPAGRGSSSSCGFTIQAAQNPARHAHDMRRAERKPAMAAQKMPRLCRGMRLAATVRN